jgi:hypothetical protein
LNLPSRFGLFVSALKIPFPGNRDFGSKRHGSNAWIIELEGRHDRDDSDRNPSGNQAIFDGRGCRNVLN